MTERQTKIEEFLRLTKEKAEATPVTSKSSKWVAAYHDAFVNEFRIKLSPEELEKQAIRVGTFAVKFNDEPFEEIGATSNSNAVGKLYTAILPNYNFFIWHYLDSKTEDGQTDSDVYATIQPKHV
ncbi:MAG: hypothetical protein LBS41_02010 [Streptococcaceae bacterium]|jgi:hypothetical protein|nr:hypothetical protein [Streptococcaceae bacterium]